MKLTVLGSSSHGNCYLFESSDSVLVLEAGVPMQQVKRALHFDITKIVACIVSHRHKDHAGYVREFLKCGIRVLALDDVFNALDIKNRVFCKSIEPQHGYVVGDWKIIALRVVHDVPCVGYIIEHREMGKTLFITDTMMLEYRIAGIRHFMLECNYADDILQDNIDAGIELPSKRGRLLETHMELETTKQIIRDNDTSNLDDVILVHLSDNNSDAARFEREVRAVAGVPTYIADAGRVFTLSNN